MTIRWQSFLMEINRVLHPHLAANAWPAAYRYDEKKQTGYLLVLTPGRFLSLTITDESVEWYTYNISKAQPSQLAHYEMEHNGMALDALHMTIQMDLLR